MFTALFKDTKYLYLKALFFIFLQKILAYHISDIDKQDQ